MIRNAIVMFVKEITYGRGAKEASVQALVRKQYVLQVASKRAMEKLRERRRKTLFLAVNDMPRQVQSSRFFKEIFCLASVQAVSGGNAHCEFDKAMVKERNPQFNRRRHAHAIGLD